MLTGALSSNNDARFPSLDSGLVWTHQVLDAVIDDLLGIRGMMTASNVVVGGCSAGGMAVYLNCDHWAERIGAANAKIDVVCLADAGWFPLIETPSVTPPPFMCYSHTKGTPLRPLLTLCRPATAHLSYGVLTMSYTESRWRG